MTMHRRRVRQKNRRKLIAKRIAKGFLLTKYGELTWTQEEIDAARKKAEEWSYAS